MERLDHTVEFYEREDGKIVAKMDDPPIEAHGRDIRDALSDLRYEVGQFAEGVHEAFTDTIRNELDGNL